MPKSVSQNSGTSVFLVRHAHRVSVDPSADNGLSEKGIAQAQSLTKELGALLSDKVSPEKIRIFSSPKIRCIETVAPLCQAFGVDPEVVEACNEQQRTEDTGQFESRVAAFLASLAGSAASKTVICSHGDWLPVATQLLAGKSVEFRNAQWIELELNSRRGVP